MRNEGGVIYSVSLGEPFYEGGERVQKRPFVQGLSKVPLSQLTRANAPIITLMFFGYSNFACGITHTFPVVELTNW
jgi:hypothetical protein